MAAYDSNVMMSADLSPVMIKDGTINPSCGTRDAREVGFGMGGREERSVVGGG